MMSVVHTLYIWQACMYLCIHTCIYAYMIVLFSWYEIHYPKCCDICTCILLMCMCPSGCDNTVNAPSFYLESFEICRTLDRLECSIWADVVCISRKVARGLGLSICLFFIFSRSWENRQTDSRARRYVEFNPLHCVAWDKQKSNSSACK